MTQQQSDKLTNVIIVGVISFLVGISCLDVHCATITTYAKRYSDSARVHPNRRYSPDSLNVATGWRELYGATLWIEAENGMRVRVKAKDCMNVRYDADGMPLHIDASPRVMRALGLRHKANVIVLIDTASLKKHK